MALIWYVMRHLGDLPSAEGCCYFIFSKVRRELNSRNLYNKVNWDSSRQINKDSQIFVSKPLPAHGFWQFCLSQLSQEWQLSLFQQAKLVIALREIMTFCSYSIQPKAIFLQAKQWFVLNPQLDLHRSEFLDNGQSQDIILIYREGSL